MNEASQCCAAKGCRSMSSPESMLSADRHRWLEMLESGGAAQSLAASIQRWARLAAAVHRAELASAGADLLSDVDPSPREDEYRVHGWTSPAVDDRLLGGSDAKECDR